MGSECELMHIDRTDEITVAREAAGAARPSSALGLVTMPTSGTLATGSSFGAGEAQDAGLFRFVGQVVDVLAVFPQGHPLIVMPASVSIAYTMRVANEETSHVVLDTEVDDSSGGFVAHISDTAFGTAAYLILGALQLLPTMGVLLAARLLLRELPKLLGALMLERADAAPGHDQGGPRSGGHRRQVDFPQVNGCLDSAWSFFCLWSFDADMQFKAVIPDQRAGPGLFWQRDGQHEGGASSAHRQNDPSFFLAHRLGGPMDRVEAFRTPGVTRTHLGVFFTQFARGFDSAEKGAKDGLYRLALEGKPSFGQLVQFGVVGPRCMGHPSLPVGLHAQVPALRRFHLRRLEAGKERRRKMLELIHANCLHMYVFFLTAAKAVMYRMGEPFWLWPAALSSRRLKADGSSRAVSIK
jgi:hypothetical protein